MRARAIAAAAFFTAAMLAGSAVAADARTAQVLADEVDQALRSSGYRVRASVSREGEAAEAALKVTLVGRREEAAQRLLIRAVAPDAFRGQAVSVDTGAGNAVRAAGYGTAGETGARAVDPYAPVFGSDLVPWDFLSLWWRWPKQARVGEEAEMGYECVVIESSGARGPVARVRSWVAPALRIPLRVEFYGADGRLLRAMRVQQVARRSNGGTAAKLVTIASANKAQSRFEIYGGEEDLELPPEAFRPEGK